VSHKIASDECVLSVDEKTSIEARVRRHPSTPPGPRRAMRVEHEYERGRAWAYLAALDVHRAKLFGRCERTGLRATSAADVLHCRPELLSGQGLAIRRPPQQNCANLNTNESGRARADGAAQRIPHAI
jgi:hypothetical protein